MAVIDLTGDNWTCASIAAELEGILAGIAAVEHLHTTAVTTSCPVTADAAHGAWDNLLWRLRRLAYDTRKQAESAGTAGLLRRGDSTQ